MIVNIITPSQPEYLYAATQVSSNASGIHVDIFPSSGVLTAIGALQETVSLGQFPAGTYNYELVIHPNYQVNWGVRTNRGTFSVESGPQTNPNPVRISSIANTANHCKLITITAPSGQVCVVQVSTNLIYWQTLGTATEHENGESTMEDTNAAGFQCRFYRIVGP